MISKLSVESLLKEWAMQICKIKRSVCFHILPSYCRACDMSANMEIQEASMTRLNNWRVKQWEESEDPPSDTLPSPNLVQSSMLVLLCWLLSRVEFRNGMWTAHPDLGSFYLLTSKEQGRTDLLRQEKCSLFSSSFYNSSRDALHRHIRHAAPNKHWQTPLRMR